MKLKVFSIHDSKAEAFIQPFYSQTTGTAVRSFEQACNDTGSDFHKFAGDYTLFELGEFDQNTAEFTPHLTPTNLGVALSYIKSDDQ